MEYVFLTFDKNDVTVSREIILSLARANRHYNLNSGYDVPVDTGLRGILSWIMNVDEGRMDPANDPCYMVYSPLTGKRNRLLLAGPYLEEWIEKFRSASSAGNAIHSVVHGSTYPSDVEWGFVSLVLPFWVILFDEDLDHIFQDTLTGNIRAAYCPGDENELERITPDLHGAVVRELLLRMILNALPWRQDEK